MATARASRQVTSPRHNQAAGIKAGQTEISLESSVEAYGYNAADNYGIYCGNYNIYLGRDLTYLLMRGETKAAECSSVLMQDDDYTVYGWTDIDGKNDTDLIDSDAGSNTAIHQKYKRISTEGDSEIVYDVSGYIGKYDEEGHSITVDIENEDPVPSGMH